MYRIRGFDGLRALAAASVVVTHLGLYRGLGHGPVAAMVGGTAAVQLFFALSGFLITALLIREQQGFGRVSIRFFYLRRAFRILPLYFLCLGAVAALQAATGDVARREGLLFAATYLYNFLPWRAWDAQLEHVWSLAVEEHFYLVWPVVFALLYPRHKRVLVAGSVLACLLAVSVQLRLPTSWTRDYVAHRWTCFAGTNILFGCVAAVLSCDQDYAPRFAAILRSRAAFALGLALWANAFVVPPTSPLCYHLRGAGFALLVGCLYHNQRGRAARLLELPPLRYLGVISYGIYMYQGLFLTTGPDRVPGRVWPLPPWLGLALLAVVVPLSYHLFEARLIRVGRRFRQSVAPDRRSNEPHPRTAAATPAEPSTA